VSPLTCRVEEEGHPRQPLTKHVLTLSRPARRRDASRDDTYWSELCKKEYNVCPKNFRPPPGEAEEGAEPSHLSTMR
jgi:hypothetical protein